MEGAHEGTEHGNERVAVGSPAVAEAQRQRAQTGVAAQGRKGKRVAVATSRLAGKKTRQESDVEAEVARAMTQGNSLVQASLEHLAEGERLWGRWIEKSGTVIKGFPSVEQVVTFMAVQSRERQRMCLAQRGDTVRAGLQKGVVRNYVSEMGNNVWATKFPAFGALAALRLRAAWRAWWLRAAAWWPHGDCVALSERMACWLCGVCCDAMRLWCSHGSGYH
jgi:hypothetical protein